MSGPAAENEDAPGERPQGARGKTETVELTKAEQAAARRVAESKATIPHLYLRAEVALGDSAGAPARAVAIEAAATALRELPRVNGSYRDGRIELHGRINVGFALGAATAPVFATVFDADTKSAAEIEGELAALADRAAEGALTAPELAGATFTVIDLGAQGVVSFDPVINPPQAAVLGLGAPGGGGLAVATLGCDHRIVHPDQGAAFLARVKELLEAA